MSPRTTATIISFGKAGSMSVDVIFTAANGTILQETEILVGYYTTPTPGESFANIIKAAVLAYATECGYDTQESDIAFGFQTVGSAAWISGVLQKNVMPYAAKATIANGRVVFYLTDDGTQNGNPVFSAVFAETLALFFNDALNSYTASAPVISDDFKSITVTVNKLGAVVLGLIQISAPADGQQISMIIYGTLA